jgi:hypothetical protein
MAWGPLRAFNALGSGSSASTDRRIFARLRCSRLGATRAQIRASACGIRPRVAREQLLTADWNLHLYSGPSCLSRAYHAVRACLASHATPLACAPCRPARRTGNSAAGDLATQRSGDDEAGY